MHFYSGDSSYSQPPHPPRVGARLPPPPASSLDPPCTEGEAGTGAAPGDCLLHRPNALLSPACPGKSHHPHGTVTRAWMALVLPGKCGAPSRMYPFQLCPQPLAHPAQDPCPCCFPAHHAGGCLPLPIRDPERGNRAGPWVACDGLDTERSQGVGDRGRPGPLPTGPPHHTERCWSLTQTWCPQSLSQPQGHCRLPGASPLRALAQPTCGSRQQVPALMRKNRRTDGSGWNFRRSGSAPPWPTSPSPQGARAHGGRGVGVGLTVLSPRSPTAK